MCISGVASANDTVLKLMGSYLVFAFTGFALILIFLEKIGAKTDPEKPCLQVSLVYLTVLILKRTWSQPLM